MNSRPGVTATSDMAVLPGVLGCRPLRRTVQVRLKPDFGFRNSEFGIRIDDIKLKNSDFATGFLELFSRLSIRNLQSAICNRQPGGTPIFFALAALRSVPHRTESGIYDKWVPSFVVSRQQFMKYPG